MVLKEENRARFSKGMRRARFRMSTTMTRKREIGGARDKSLLTKGSWILVALPTLSSRRFFS
jgi:hypothetical protein